MVAAGWPPGGQGQAALISRFSRSNAHGTRFAIPGPVVRSWATHQGRKVMEQSRLKVCYVITQRGEKKYWNRVGVAFLNHDGSINVKLESLPVAGDFQIRDYVARDEAGTTLRGKNGQSDDEAFAA
jgi:hypothetical protein